MITAEKPADEPTRLASLLALQVLDTPPEERFDRLTRLTQRLFDVPTVLISLVDAERQWYKSRQGMDAEEGSREASFCGHAIHGDEILEVPDAVHDERFADNPSVTGDPNVRFYAGCPIAAPDGSRVGTLCVIDQTPRSLSEDDRATLRDLARMVEQELAALQLAIADEVTKLANRRGFVVLGEQLLRIARRTHRPVSVIVADLDGMKEINDTLGHAHGDDALRGTAELLERCFRASDIVARVGGDEFAVAMLDAGIENARVVADRLEAMIDEHNSQAGRPYTLSLSIGISSTDACPDASIEQLAERADAAMYQVKRTRRTRSGDHSVI